MFETLHVICVKHINFVNSLNCGLRIMDVSLTFGVWNSPFILSGNQLNPCVAYVWQNYIFNTVYMLAE